MNLQPTIFISSIISEFYDLRGALRYFLGKSGFRVLMSEEPDFGADCGIDSLDNCKKQIEKSDYYLLLIGNNPGTVFTMDQKQTTVTYEEFNHFITLKKDGKKMNLIAFVRQQAWDNYTISNFEKIHPLQYKLIDELINGSLFKEKKIGRWRYTFNKFSDIISTLETNQNGLFLDATRKSVIYKMYIKREVTDIYKSFLSKGDDGNTKSLVEITSIPKMDNLDLIESSKIPKEIAVKIVVFFHYTSYKDSLLRKINRVFNYIAQGEFSRFDADSEGYILPEYIKLTIQTLEILERIFDNAKNISLLNEISKRDVKDFQINGGEYFIIRSAFMSLQLAISKLTNLVICFHENWFDIAKRDDSFYEYRGGLSSISDVEALEYAHRNFKKD